MKRTSSNHIVYGFALVVAALIVWFAIDVFFLGFAAILLAITMHAMGTFTKKIIRLPYLLCLFIALIAFTGIFVLIFWLYSPFISEQFHLLVEQLPSAFVQLQKTVTPYLDQNLTLKNELAFTNTKILNQVVTFFSTTMGSIASFVIFLVVGLYLAMTPERYLNGALFTIPDNHRQQVKKIILKIGNSLRIWLFGKILSMIAIGLLTSIGLAILNISLAVILGVLAGIFTFIPYVGPILTAIPAILIAFTQNPLTALYVIILYLGVHILEGYLITPYIEQKTVSIPPALTIMSQILLYVLIGGLGLALATPIIVVLMALIVSLKSSHKIVNKAQKADN